LTVHNDLKQYTVMYVKVKTSNLNKAHVTRDSIGAAT